MNGKKQNKTKNNQTNRNKKEKNKATNRSVQFTSIHQTVFCITKLMEVTPNGKMLKYLKSLFLFPFDFN